ncbi:hypothetical protein HRbin05_00511 [archaeon HR05]|nr:hypothetical protein HRbin05_00511 [archaeon HR05]
MLNATMSSVVAAMILVDVLVLVTTGSMGTFALL